MDGNYWNDVADRVEGFYSDNPFFQYKKRELLELIERWGKGLLGGKVLKTDLYEEALGYDDLLFDLAKSNDDVYGMDISPRMVEAAEQRAIERGVKPKFSVQDARSLTFDSNIFDLVISNSTFDHFPEVEDAIRESSRVLKPGGVMILTLHNKHNPAVYLLCKAMKALNKYHDFYTEGSFSLDEIKKMAEKSGLSVTDWEAIIHIPPVFPTIINKLYKNKHKFIRSFSEFLVVFFDKIGNQKFLNRFTGYLIAVKAVKNR